MAYDPGTRVIVLFGGSDRSNAFLADTWTFNGSNWSEVFPAKRPPALASASMAYDPATGDVVLFGGADSSDRDSDATWAFTGSRWTEVFPSTSPPGRRAAAMAYDPATKEMILFGGEAVNGGFGALLNDTWTFNGTSWSKVVTATSPSARQTSMAYDPATSEMVLFGGYAGLGLAGPSSQHRLDDTWTFNGTDWNKVSPTTTPPGRFSASMAYDSATGDIVLFGGAQPTNNAQDPIRYLDDTWTFNGTNWSEASSPTSPPGRFSASMAYDSAAAEIVLFGGMGLPESWFDTWTWKQT